MTPEDRRRQMDRVQECIRITERKAKPEDLTEADALEAERSLSRTEKE